MAENYKILSQEFAAPDEISFPANIVVAVDPMNGRFAKGSYDGTSFSWTVDSTNIGARVVYGSGTYVTAGSYFSDSNVSYYSTDGITWTQNTLPYNMGDGGHQNFDLAYVNDRFEMIGSVFDSTGVYITSTDGISWSDKTFPAGYTFSNARHLTYGEGKYFINNVYNFPDLFNATSTDGSSWTFTSTSLDIGYRDVVYGDGKFVASVYEFAVGFKIQRSTDGISWTTSTSLSSPIDHLTYGNGKFVGVGQSSSTVSTDGITWQVSTTTPIPDASIQSIDFDTNSQRYVAVGVDSGGAWAGYSTDGLSWTTDTSIPSGSWTSVSAADPYTDRPLTSKTLYTVPANTEASISSISVINNGTVSGDYYLGVVKSADSSTPGISEVQTIIPTRTIDAGVTDEIVGGITLSAGDQIRIFTESPDITAHIYGAEIS